AQHILHATGRVNIHQIFALYDQRWYASNTKGADTLIGLFHAGLNREGFVGFIKVSGTDAGFLNQKVALICTAQQWLTFQMVGAEYLAMYLFRYTQHIGHIIKLSMGDPGAAKHSGYAGKLHI